MGKGLRYNIEHIGDTFVGGIMKASDAAKTSARGIVLTYDLNDLKKKRQGIVHKIGERLVQLRNDNPDLNIAEDEEMPNLLSESDRIKKEIEAAEKELEERLYPCKQESDQRENTGCQERRQALCQRFSLASFWGFL